MSCKKGCRTAVLKFGGASVATPAHFALAAKIVLVRAAKFDRLVVVVSAMGDTTDHLIALAEEVSPSPPQREKDMLVSVGERISGALLAMAIDRAGGRAISLTGSQAGMITTSDHSNARIIDVQPFRIEKWLDQKMVVVIAGFQGVSLEKEVTTLGRGGSDISAVALGAALGAEQVEFYKDVPGIYLKDPKRFPVGEPISRLSYNEAIAIAREGGVLEVRSVILAQRNHLPLHIYAHDAPFSAPGTVIGAPGSASAALPIYEEAYVGK